MQWFWYPFFIFTLGKYLWCICSNELWKLVNYASWVSDRLRISYHSANFLFIPVSIYFCAEKFIRYICDGLTTNVKHWNDRICQWRRYPGQPWASYQISKIKLRVAHAPGMPGTFSPPPRVSDSDMHHGTCVTHVPWCMTVSLTNGFILNRWRGKRSRHSRRMRNPQFCVSGKKLITTIVVCENIANKSGWIWHQSGGIFMPGKSTIPYLVSKKCFSRVM